MFNLINIKIIFAVNFLETPHFADPALLKPDPTARNLKLDVDPCYCLKSDPVSARAGKMH